MTLIKALERLTDRQRTLIRLRDHEKLTWAKVGEAIGVGGQYAAQLWKAAKRDLAKWEATDEKDLYDATKHVGKWSWKDGPPPEQTPPPAIPEPAPAVSEPFETHSVRSMGYLRMKELAAEEAQKQLAEPAPAPRTVISRGQPASAPPKVVVVRGQPVDKPLPVNRHWSSVTIRS